MSANVSLCLKGDPKENNFLSSPPVPPLDQTLQKYLDYAYVLTDEAAFESLQRRVERFIATDGPRLQNSLIKIAHEEKNWINRFWLKSMYLENRLPLPLYSNPGYFAYTMVHRSPEDFFGHAASLIHAVFDFKKLIDKKSIPVEWYTRQGSRHKMCMSQYWDIFTSYRHANFGVDVLQKNLQTTPPTDAHITVLVNNQIYILPVMRSGKISSREQIARTLAFIKDQRPAYDTPIGVITAVERDKAAEAYRLLEEDTTNRESLNSIKRSSFILCLDERTAPGDTDLTPEERSLMHMVSAGGPDESLLNRWFDKTFQFILTKDGDVGINYEHSVAEGAPMFKIADHIKDFISEDRRIEYEETADDVHAHLLQWNLSPKTASEITSYINDSRFTEDLDIRILVFSKYGKDYIKCKRMSPDLYVQLSLQWTMYKLEKRLVSTYESASLRRFIYGRVDNIRAATREALRWVEVMENPSASNEEKITAFKQAADRHEKVIQETLSGYGIDNHLVALKELAINEMQTVPDIFTDQHFMNSFNFLLSTSQLPWLTSGAIGYGPVAEDGYGCAYNIASDKLTFFISSMKSCSRTSALLFRTTLQKTLDDMKTFTQSFSE